MGSKSGKAGDVRAVSPRDDAAWDALVSASPTGNRFLQSDCLRMLEDTDSIGIRFRRLGAFNGDGELRAGWALPYMKRFGVCASTYFDLFYAGPMFAPELETGSVHVCRERLDTLFDLAADHARHIQLVEAEGHPRLEDARGIHYAGWKVETLYTHMWRFGSADDLFGKMNRERRRVIRRANETYRFEPLPAETAAAEFIPLYHELMRKFDWQPTAQWDRDFSARLDWLIEHGVASVYGARSDGGELCGAVVVLLSMEDRTIYLWRCGYKQDIGGNTIIPALYWNASLYWLEQWGEPLDSNLGGSPQFNLSQFKDYLGTDVVPHLRFVWRAPGVRSLAWRTVRAVRDRMRRRLTRAGLLTSDASRTEEVPRQVGEEEGRGGNLPGQSSTT